nr:venom protein [Lampona murina]
MRTSLECIHYGYALFFVLIGPVIIVSPTRDTSEKKCGEISEDECLKKVQTFLRLKSLPFTTEEAELNRFCSETEAGYNCSATKSSIPNCLSPPDKDMFQVYTEMAQYLMYMFCANENGGKGYLREDLLKNSECILKQKGALDCCAEAAKLTDLPVMYVFEDSSKSMKDRQMAACCPIANYLKCAVPIVEQNCGEVAANLTTRYVRRSSGEPIEALCQKMPNYPDVDSEICEAPPAVCSASRIGIFFELITLMSFLFIMKINYM